MRLLASHEIPSQHHPTWEAVDGVALVIGRGHVAVRAAAQRVRRLLARLWPVGSHHIWRGTR
jgi:hypothetical protein